MPSTSSALALARTQLSGAGANHPNDQLTTDVAHLVVNRASGIFYTGERQIITVVNGQTTVRSANPHAFS